MTLTHLYVKSTLYLADINHQGINFGPFRLYDYPFSKYKVVKNQKCTEWPQNDL